VTGNVANAFFAAVPDQTLADAQKALDSGNPHVAGFPLPGVQAKVHAAVTRETRTGNNVVAYLPATTPAASGPKPWLALGAHYDHLGRGDSGLSLASKDEAGRIHGGADDNASGTAALLEVVEALALAKPRRTVLACAFAAEEDGMLGSKALCDSPPVPRDKLVAMLNMDMLGRGDPSDVVVFGLVQNPAFDKLLERAKKLAKTGIKTITPGKDEDLFKRSDHFSFHQIGVPEMFFFEHMPLDDNHDYHTWRDTLDQLDFDKLTRTARLVFNSTWLIANDDERPPKPRG
jgi:Zn-dependent M28 family amino/carboxypeptidase